MCPVKLQDKETGCAIMGSRSVMDWKPDMMMNARITRKENDGAVKHI